LIGSRHDPAAQPLGLVRPLGRLVVRQRLG
jgi:hypothetical protein